VERDQPPEAPRLTNFAEPAEDELPRWFARVNDFFQHPNRIHYCPHCHEHPLCFHVEYTLTPRESALWVWCERCTILLFLRGPAGR
jgi:hypothetical protein